MSDFAIEYNGLTINETSGYIIREADGLDDIPIRTSQFNLTGADGGVVDAQKYGMRIIGLRGTVVGSSVSDYFTKKANLLRAFSINPSDDTLTVTNWNSVSRSISAKVLQQPRIVLKTGEVSFADFSMVLIANDPFWGSTAADNYTVNLSKGGGTPVASPVPSPVGGGTSDRVTVVNGGDVAGYGDFTITGACVNPTVTNTTTGESFQITGTFTAVDILRIYFDNTGLHVLRNGSNYMSYFTGTFFDIGVGNNIIRFTSGTYYSGTQLSIDYYNKYFTI